MDFLNNIPANIIVVLDEAYDEYLTEEHKSEAFSWLSTFENLIISRSFSKAYGLAGLRVGFGVGSSSLIEIMNRIRQPFNVNYLAQQAAIASLDDDDFIQLSKKINSKGMKQISEALDNLDIKYICASPETFKTDIKFDVILNMEIIEHVENIDFFLESCSKLLKKNGIMFVATLNKTLRSYLFAIVGAEYVLKWLPIGTHDWEKFVKPEYLIDILQKYNLELDSLDGMKFNLIKDEWFLSSDKSVNYIGKFIKN